MFNKAFRVKSSSQIKSSDRKKLRATIAQKFPNLENDDVVNLIPAKDEMRASKICTHSGTHVLVYYKQKTPIFFEVDKTLYPTVYTLWMYPNILHKFYTLHNVLEKMAGGADLMLPGVIVDEENYGPNSFGTLEKYEMCAVCLIGNDAPVAVGLTMLSSRDMFESGKRGKGVNIKHVYTDQLWASGESTSPPLIESILLESDYEENESNENGGCQVTAEMMENLEVVDELTEKTKEPEDVIEDDEDERSPVEVMDDLLLSSFLCAWKTTAKKLELPVLTSTFFRLYMLPCCPPDHKLDIKKSSYKKLSKFLKEMEAGRMIAIKELSKGVESITDVDLGHPSIKSYRVVKCDVKTEEAVVKSDVCYVPPEVSDLYFVTAQVLPVFRDFGYGKGRYLNASDIRKVITEYVKENELQHPDNKRLVKLDPRLTDCVLSKAEFHTVAALQWEDIFSRMISKMQPGYQLTFPNLKPIVKKGKLEPIDISVVQRSGNKKVTLIHNLVTYCIDPSELAHKVQIGVAASTSVNPSPPNRKDGPQVLVQGNQVKYVGNVLLDEYKLPRRLIKGLDLASKKKNK